MSDFRKKSKAFPKMTDVDTDLTLKGGEAYVIMPPCNRSWWSNQIVETCKKRLSTGAVPFLEKLYSKTFDPFLRSLLARKIHWCRIEYLRSFKEHSDRALILLAERENLFDKWEGIYILGTYGRGSALKYLQALATQQNEPLLQHAIQRSIQKIKNNIAKKQGFG